MNPRTPLAALAAVALLAACSSDDGSSEPSDVTLTLLAYDSFTPSDGIFDSFTEDTGIRVEVAQAGDAGEMVSKAVLTAGNPEGDVMWGVDNTLLSRAIDGEVFSTYESPALADVPADLTALVPDDEVTPVDYGDVCVNYDIAALEEAGIPRPETLDDLIDPRFADTLVVENPVTSSPGLAFLLATIGAKGDGWQDYWSALRENGVKVVDDWDTAYYAEFTRAGGDRPLVVSYASSPPAEVLYADPPLAEGAPAPTAVAAGTCFRQVEFAGVLRGTDHEDEARQLVDFLLGPTFQADLPLTLFVYPANQTVELPPVFQQYATPITDAFSVAPADIAANRQQWIDDWTSTVLEMTAARPYGRVVPLVAAVLPVAVLGLFFVWPVATILARGLGGDALADVLGNERVQRSVIWFTVWQAVVSTVLTIMVGLAPAYVLARYRFPGRRFVAALVTVPFVLPTVVVAAALGAALPPSLDHGVPAILVAHVLFNVAVVVRTVGAAWEQLDPDLTAAARTLGAGPLQAFALVTLPQLRSAMLAAASIVFLFTFSSFGVVLLLGGPSRATVEVEIYLRGAQLGDQRGAAALAFLQLVAIGLLLWWWGRAQARHTVTSGARAGLDRQRPRTPRQRALVAIVATVSAGAVLLPLVALVRRSVTIGDRVTLDAWRHLGSSEIRPGVRVGVDPLTALANSMRFATLATVIAVVVGGLAAGAIAYAGRSGWLLDSGLMLPLGTSAVTLGFGILITFDTAPLDLRASPALIPIAHALVAIPFVVRAVLGVLRSVPQGLREAAATLGAPPAHVWREVDAPLVARAVAVGAGFAFAVSIGEFGATSFLTRRGNETLPIAIDRLLGRTGDILQAQAYALATILAAATLVVVMVVDTLGGTVRGRTEW